MYSPMVAFVTMIYIIVVANFCNARSQRIPGHSRNRLLIPDLLSVNNVTTCNSKDSEQKSIIVYMLPFISLRLLPEFPMIIPEYILVFYKNRATRIFHAIAQVI